MSVHNDQIWEIDNLPNRLTILRMILIPLVIGILYLSEFDFFLNLKPKLTVIACLFYFIASVTDFFDGYIARKRNLVTVFGSFLDPIADKFLVVSLLIFFGSIHTINVIVIIILVLREMYMTALRLMAYERELKVPVSKLGKYKTAIQMLALGFLMVDPSIVPFPNHLIGQILIYLACFFSLYSASKYTRTLIIRIKVKRRQKKKNYKEKEIKV